MARRRNHDEHDNHEAWAIPYGDLVTLLLAFFVVMYGMSSVNEGKYRVLSDSLAEAFNGNARAAQPPPDAGHHTQPVEQLPLAQVNRMITGGLPARHQMQAPQQSTPTEASTEADKSGADAQAALADANANE